MWHKWVNQARRASFCFLLEWGGVKDSLPELCQSFWSHSTPNFWTSQSRFLLSNWFFFSSGTICFLLKPMILTKPAKATAWLLGQGQNCILAKCGTSSTKIRLFLEYAKIKQVKERLCWWSEMGGQTTKKSLHPHTHSLPLVEDLEPRLPLKHFSCLFLEFLHQVLAHPA